MPATRVKRTRQAKQAIVIVDDHPMLRRGLTALIESEPDLTVCAEAATAEAALQAIEQSDPDLVIVDLALGASDGLDLVKKIKLQRPKTPSLVISAHDESLYAERAIRVGARGYINKQELTDTVLIAIRSVLNDEIYLSEKMAARFAAKFLGAKAQQEDSPLAVLTNHELEVFRLIGQGESSRQIAQRLHLSIKTIESYRQHIKQKLTLASGAELVRRATNWVETGQTS